ncbi:unnamed protein product [Rhodiola kirilowii]
MRCRFHISTIRNSSSETGELAIGKLTDETKNHPRTEMQLVQYNPLDIHHPHALDKYQDVNPVFDNYYGDNDHYHEPTMGELTAPKIETQPWCICQSPELENIIVDTNNLPRFSGTNEESAMTHLQRLHGVCQNLKPFRVNLNDFKLKAFYFSLVDSANDWFLSLPSGSIRTWDQMQKKFLDKYYPAGRAMQVRRQLQDIKQGPNETMYDYLEKFNRLERSCCTLGLPEKLIIEYLINGLTKRDKMFLDASAGGSIMNLPLSRVRQLINSVAENARFEEETTRQDGSFQTKKRLTSRRISKLYARRDESNKGNSNATFTKANCSSKTVRGLCNSLSTTMHQNQAETKGELSNLKKDISQLTASITAHANESGRLLSQTIQIMEDVNALTLRSGKTLASEPLEQGKDKDPRLPRKEQTMAETLETLEEEATDKDDDLIEEDRNASEVEENTSQEHRPDPVPRTESPRVSTTLPFPVPARMQKRHVMDKEVLELFSKVEINIPLLEAIKQIPRYAKFLKELCINRRRNTGNDQELISRNVSAVMQRKVPPKCGDPGTYTIPCKIGNIRIDNCMLDLGASINVLPFSIYSCLKIGPLKPTGLTIQLADRSCKQPEGKIEDVLVQVGKLVFPADFYVLKMENGGSTDDATHPSRPSISKDSKNEDRLWKRNAINRSRRRNLQL